MQVNKFVQLHIIILLWGFTPVLGKLISLQALDLVWYRLLISGITIYMFARYKGIRLHVSKKSLLEILGMGFIVGIHWYTFYHAIKVSNVSVTMAGFSTITLFASLLQPLILKKKFFWGDLIYGVIIGGGLLIILNFEKFYAKGIFYAIISSFTAAFFGIYNGKLIKQHESVTITLIEFIGAFITLTVLILLMGENPNVFLIPEMSDWIYLLILSILCTTVAFTWSIYILKQFSPLTVIITNNLEPIYGIVFSVLIFGQSEYMSLQFYIGAAIILIGVFTYPFIQKKWNIT